MKRIKTLHFISGLIITTFVGLHLLNHLMAIFGADVHILLMGKLRMVYRSILGESVLLLAVLVQLVSGLKLFFSKRKLVEGFFQKLQVWSGLYLAFFLLIHVGAVLAGRQILNLDTNFYFGVAGLNTFPLNLFFIPYYALAITSIFGHLAAIHHQKMKRTVFGLTPEQQSKLIIIKGIIVTVIIFYGATNGFAGVVIPEEYSIMIGN